MANIITPMDTNLAASGKTISLSGSIEFDVGAHGSGRQALIQLLTTSLAFDQMLTFQVDVTAAQTDYNLWEAAARDLGARCVAVVCLYGSGAVAVNGGATPTGFPMSADATAGNSWFIYNNPSGGTLEVGAEDTGPGIQKIAVSTEVESRFLVMVFL